MPHDARRQQQQHGIGQLAPAAAYIHGTTWVESFDPVNADGQQMQRGQPKGQNRLASRAIAISPNINVRSMTSSSVSTLWKLVEGSNGRTMVATDAKSRITAVARSASPPW